MKLTVTHLRLIFQVFFITLCLWIGFEFISFVQFFESGGNQGQFNRPAGVDGFLPISSLMNFVYFIKSGQIHNFHPAGFFIFFAISLISFIIGKSFCSWLCFVGTLSEKLADLSEKKFKIKFHVPKVIDYPLRSFKYLLLFFFLYHILNLDLLGLKNFLDGDYNLIADIKMYYFFAHISSTAFIVISILILFSLFIRNFWCRYFCPYGAYLGLLGIFSPFKIKREKTSCIDCNRCTMVCPSRIQVAKKNYIVSDECSSCLKCIEACPVKNTLNFHLVGTTKKISPLQISVLIFCIYMLVISLGMFSGNWNNKISIEQYQKAYGLRDKLKHH